MIGLELVKLPKTSAGGTTVILYQISQTTLDVMMQITDGRIYKDVSERLQLAA